MTFFSSVSFSAEICKMSCAQHVEQLYRSSCENGSSALCKEAKDLICSSAPNPFPELGDNNISKIETYNKFCKSGYEATLIHLDLASQVKATDLLISDISNIVENWKSIFTDCSSSEEKTSICYINLPLFVALTKNLEKLILSIMIETKNVETRGRLHRVYILLSQSRELIIARLK